MVVVVIVGVVVVVAAAAAVAAARNPIQKLITVSQTPKPYAHCLCEYLNRPEAPFQPLETKAPRYCSSGLGLRI